MHTHKHQTSGWFKRHRIEILLFLVALVLRLAYVSISLTDISSTKLLSLTPDTVNYVKAADALANGTKEYEEPFFSFGPGYPVFLLLQFMLFGHSPMPLIVINILLSCFSVVFLYQLCELLTGSRLMAGWAGFILAGSAISIELSCLLLSDSLFFFLVVAGLVWGIRGLQQGKFPVILISGITLGLAILTRSVGQFLPVILVLLSFVVYRAITKETVINRRKYIQYAFIWIGCVIGIEGSWIVRNMAVTGVATLTSTSAGGAANVAAMSLHPDDLTRYRETTSGWEQEERTALNTERLTTAQGFRLFRKKFAETFRNNPIQVLKIIPKVVWMNLNEITFLHRIQMPAYKPETIKLEYLIRDNRLQYLEFILSILGIFALIVRKQYGVAILLGCMYAYFALMLAATLFQGSRPFYPGLIASSILMAVASVSFCELVLYSFKKIITTVRHRKKAALE